MSKDYWIECIESSFEEAGIIATKEQIQIVADDVEMSHECYGMYHGYDAIPNPSEEEISKLKALIEKTEKERDDMEYKFKQNIAKRRKCDVTDIEIGENGSAFIH